MPTDSYLLTVRLRGDGEPRTVATICEADSRGQAEQIALDINDEAPRADILATRRIADLQIVHRLTHTVRGGLAREEE